MPPSEPICFTFENRRWVARQWSNSQGAPERFWNVTPKHPENMPDWIEARRAREFFERQLTAHE